MNWPFWHKATKPAPGPQTKRATLMGVADKGFGECILDLMEKNTNLERRIESLEKRMEETAPWLAP